MGKHYAGVERGRAGLFARVVYKVHFEVVIGRVR